MTKELLIRKASRSEWEAEHLVNGVPFGFCNREWEALTSKKNEGDEIWFWSTNQMSWDELMGMEGMALVRGSEIVDWFITALN